MNRTLLIVVFTLFIYSMTYSQTPKIYDKFEDFEPLLHMENDTTYVINFWATWCVPCVAELPYFYALNDQYESEAFKMILVSLDFVRHIDTKLIPFIEKHKIKPEVIVLSDSKEIEWIDKVDPSWSGAIPITLVYKGKKRAFYEQSFHSFDELNNIIKPFFEN